jgi:hypothetical protein
MIDVKALLRKKSKYLNFPSKLHATGSKIYENRIFIFSSIEINFGFASFFVSPARHGEAQDMSGT